MRQTNQKNGVAGCDVQLISASTVGSPIFTIYHMPPDYLRFHYHSTGTISPSIISLFSVSRFSISSSTITPLSILHPTFDSNYSGTQ